MYDDIRGNELNCSEGIKKNFRFQTQKQIKKELQVKKNKAIRQKEKKKNPKNYEEGPGMMDPGSLIPAPVTTAPPAAPLAIDPVAVEVELLLLDKAANVEPSLTARIDGVEMDF